ncbi:hypothetical protein AB0F16_39550, partial [Streptomyces tanashiensis]
MARAGAASGRVPADAGLTGAAGPADPAAGLTGPPAGSRRPAAGQAGVSVDLNAPVHDVSTLNPSIAGAAGE